MPRPLLLFAHGAGAGSSSPWMTRHAARLSAFADVVLFDYPYMRAGKRAPDRLPKLIDAHREALQEARRNHRGTVVLIGKSMGGRVGCHLALEQPVDGIVCLGYPLVGMGKSGKPRDEVLRELGTPILFVQGTRDSLCPLDLLASVRADMTAQNELLVIDGGDHSLQPTRGLLHRLGLSQADIDVQIAKRVETFVAALR